MLTLILLGILLSIRAEERGFIHPRNYLPPLLAFTLATLVKFTIIPIVIFFILTLAFKALRLASSTDLTTHGENILHTLHLHWRSALFPALSAGGASVLTAFLFYGPFWISHDILDIMGSITSPPSASSAQFSIQRALVEWYNSSFSSPDSGGNIILQLFLSHDTWSHINIAAITISLLLGAIWLWHRPTTRTVVLATLASLCILLIVTPWFYSWYVIWLVGLAVTCLPAADRIERALVAFALTFSVSAFATYLYLYGYPPFGTWSGFVCLTTIGPPLLSALIFMVPWPTRGRTTSNTSRKRRLLHFKN
jgi:hypothetical protein